MERISQDEGQNEGHKNPDEVLSLSTSESQMMKRAAPRRSNWMKELESLEIKSLQYGPSVVPNGLDASELHMTRHKTRNLQRISEKPSIFDTRKSHQEISESDNEKKVGSRFSKRSRPAPKHEVIEEISDPPNAAALRKVLSQKRADGLMKWGMWQQRKKKVTNMLECHDYPLSSSKREDWIEIKDELEHLDMTVQNGVHIFRPTVDMLNDFEKFLMKVEDIADRETGVVKVIIPEGLLLQPDTFTEYTGHPSPSVENTMVIKYLTKMNLRASELQYLPIYDVRMMGGLRQSISTCYEEVQSHRRSTLELYGKDQSYLGDIFKDVNFATTCLEEIMVESGARSSNDRYYSADIEATYEKRKALHCGKLILNEFHSYGRFGVQTDKDEIHQPKFQIAGAFGSSFGLQLTSFGAYSLNFLHSGAPKCWTIIKPADHQKIEFELHPDAEQASSRGRRISVVRLTSVDSDVIPYAKNQKKLERLPCDFPPRCDLFLNHQPFYIPEDSLQASEIEYTNVVQHKGDLIIIFPFAYRQGYSCGPNIAEEIAYTNERSDTLTQEGLYHHCHAACTGPKPPIDFEAFPTAAASDARRVGNLLIPKIIETCKAKAPIQDHRRREKTNKDTSEKPKLVVILKLISTPSFLREKSSEQESSRDTDGNQGMKKEGLKRRRLIRAADLPAYNARTHKDQSVGISLMWLLRFGSTDLEPPGRWPGRQEGD